MQRFEEVKYCPRCGNAYGPGAFVGSEVVFECSGCGYMFYQNSAPSATMMIPSAKSPGSVLLLTRATRPGIGKLALPGGFLKYGEDPAEGALREAYEETTLNLTVDRLLDSYLVDYCYQGSQVSVLEVVYLALPIEADPAGLSTGEARSVVFHSVSEMLLHRERLAFPQQIRALARYAAATGVAAAV